MGQKKLILDSSSFAGVVYANATLCYIRESYRYIYIYILGELNGVDKSISNYPLTPL